MNELGSAASSGTLGSKKLHGTAGSFPRAHAGPPSGVTLPGKRLSAVFFTILPYCMSVLRFA